MAVERAIKDRDAKHRDGESQTGKIAETRESKESKRSEMRLGGRADLREPFFGKAEAKALAYLSAALTMEHRT
jgi:hypothetical protein